MYPTKRKDIKGMSESRTEPMSKPQRQLYRKLGKVANKTPYAKKYKKKGSKNLKKTTKKKYPKEKAKKKKEYLIGLKKEKEMAEKGWKVARTKTYLELPKKAIGKKGYPYAVLNKNNHYESFYTWKETWKEKTTKKRSSN